jgi:hypothetical protein
MREPGAAGSGGVFVSSGAGGSAGLPVSPAGGNGGAILAASGGSNETNTAGAPEGGAIGAPEGGVGGAPDGGAGGVPEGGAGGEPCTGPVTWYEDKDGDGFGTEESVFACPAPEGKWARVSGDCDDTRSEVNPKQTKYFGVPYQAADGTDSFDYDCDGHEEPNPTLALAPNDCGALSLALCRSSSGYASNNRMGPGIYAWCGSTLVRQCIASVLVCEMSESQTSTPFSCR